MIKIIIIKFIDDRGRTTGREKRIQPAIAHKQRDARISLVTEILTHHALPGGRIIRPTYPASEQQLRIGHGKGRQHHHPTRLHIFDPRQQIEITDAPHSLRGVIVIQAEHLTVTPQFKMRLLLEPGIEQDFWRALRISLTDEAFTVAAILARAQPHSIRINVGPRRISRGRGKGVIAKLARHGFFKNQPSLGHF